MEDGLYEKLVIIRQMESDDKKEEEKTKKYKFQGK